MAPGREALMQAIGWQIARFQDASQAFDDTAAEVLALDRPGLACMTTLLMRGALSPRELAETVNLTRSELASSVARLEAAGYVRRMSRERLELTDHARRWIETIWGPLAADGARVLSKHSDAELRAMSSLLEQIIDVKTSRGSALRKTLVAGGRARATGGLAPAALRRVTVFVEAHLDRSIRLDDLAERARLSTHHFARAFKLTTGQTPRAFLEARRVERAKTLLRESASSLAEVALLVGLGTQSRFTTTFRRATGVTPARYRRSVRD